MGNVKGVIAPEDISMNCSEDAKPPKCPIPGHAWQSIVHKDEATWLAYYKDTINGEFKYIFMSAGSSLKRKLNLYSKVPARYLPILFSLIMSISVGV